MKGRSDTLGVLIDGAVAGAAATWLMGKVTEFLYQKEDPCAREREERVRQGKTSYGTAAEKAARLVGESLSDEQRKRYGKRLHWALGAGAGAAYALLRDQVPAAAAAGGLLFGTAFFLLMDEGLVYALGLTPGPSKFPWQSHARGLAGHLAYGAATERALTLINGGA
ncbi:MAG TPA: DUF1440 domain-containing protein [Gemmatimonadaceae bacterium]|jgi:hypothetical protein|nr:DUF1440 domain-containing protein [Gemmatimonadaceae bacterium]